MGLEDWLKTLEHESRDWGIEDAYLWPRTPVDNIQAEIWRRCGASDWTLKDGSRAGLIVTTLREMRENLLLRESFTFLDICTGDGLIPWHVVRSFPFTDVFGVDIAKGYLETHERIQRHGVALFRVPIQALFTDHRGGRFDVVCMLNTYRGWDSADLKDEEKWIPDGADLWFQRHARYTILTVTDEQRKRLINSGFWVTRIGSGENGSDMVLMWPCANEKTGGLWSQKRQ